MSEKEIMTLLSEAKKAKVYLKDGNVLVGDSQGIVYDDDDVQCIAFKPTYSALYFSLYPSEIEKVETI